MKLYANSSSEDRCRWFLGVFLTTDFKKLTDGELLDLQLGANAFAYATPVSEPVAIMLSSPGSKPLPSVRDLRGLQRYLVRAVHHLGNNGTWRVPPIAKRLMFAGGTVDSRRLTFGNPARPIWRIYRGPFRTMFLNQAADILTEHCRRLRKCANRTCDAIFLPHGRQAYCSPDCSRRERWARFTAKSKRSRDYKAEFARRWRAGRMRG